MVLMLAVPITGYLTVMIVEGVVALLVSSPLIACAILIVLRSRRAIRKC